MIIAGIIAFVLVSIFMIIVYRLPGIIAAIALAGPKWRALLQRCLVSSHSS